MPNASDMPPARILSPAPEPTGRLLTPDLLALLGELGGRFRVPVDRLLEARAQEQQRLDAGGCPIFRPKRVKFASRTGKWPRFLPICAIGGLKSPDRSTAR